MTGWIKGYSVCCVCTIAAAARKTNPPKKKTVRPDDETDLGLLFFLGGFVFVGAATVAHTQHTEQPSKDLVDQKKNI
jgi:hypothetical protein